MRKIIHWNKNVFRWRRKDCVTRVSGSALIPDVGGGNRKSSAADRRKSIDVYKCSYLLTCLIPTNLLTCSSYAAGCVRNAKFRRCGLRCYQKRRETARMTVTVSGEASNVATDQTWPLHSSRDALRAQQPYTLLFCRCNHRLSMTSSCIQTFGEYVIALATCQMSNVNFNRFLAWTVAKSTRTQ